jgi:tetratricopeptide (TPR) repeat protein
MFQSIKHHSVVCLLIFTLLVLGCANTPIKVLTEQQNETFNPKQNKPYVPSFTQDEIDNILNRMMAMEAFHTKNEAIQDTTNVELNEHKKLEKYNELITRGLQLWSVEEYQSSINVYTEAIELIPEKPDAYYGRAMVYYLRFPYRQEYEKAINDLTTAIKYNPSNAEYFCLRGDVYFANSDEFPFTNMLRMSLEEYTNKEYTFYITNMYNAISDYTTASKLDPKNYKYIYKRGTMYLYIKNWNIAIRDLTIAIENMDPNGIHYNLNIQFAYRNRGQAFYEIGIHDLAVNDFRTYSKLEGKEYTVENYIAQKNRDAEIYREKRKKR